VGRLITKRESDANQQKQEYSKEIQPIKNKPVNHYNINTYNYLYCWCRIRYSRLRNRRPIRNSLSSFSTNTKNRLSRISERFKNPRAYQAQVDVVPSVASSPAASFASSQASYVAGSRRPSNASRDGGNIINRLSETVGISPVRAARESPRDSEVL
jgi:hypothetical protein